MNWQSVLGVVSGFASLIASGPWGAVGVVAALGLVAGAYYYFVRKANDSRDAADLEKGGADASQTAIDLRQQSDANNAYVEKQREELLKQGPPEQQK